MTCTTHDPRTRCSVKTRTGHTLQAAGQPLRTGRLRRRLTAPDALSPRWPSGLSRRVTPHPHTQLNHYTAPAPLTPTPTTRPKHTPSGGPTSAGMEPEMKSHQPHQMHVCVRRRLLAPQLHRGSPTRPTPPSNLQGGGRRASHSQSEPHTFNSTSRQCMSYNASVLAWERGRY